MRKRRHNNNNKINDPRLGWPPTECDGAPGPLPSWPHSEPAQRNVSGELGDASVGPSRDEMAAGCSR